MAACETHGATYYASRKTPCVKCAVQAEAALDAKLRVFHAAITELVAERSEND